ncbi:hypothetical protein MKX01_028195 [Papaver californicum]|nr:hypothetical protein MKX01_028195 [Papaver californicum]
MRSDAPLDYAVFQLSPRRSRCELFVSSNGDTEKLASGLLKPFLTHLTVAEEQARQAVQSIKLEIEKRKNEGIWFTKGTIERFVRFVTTPEVLELVNTFDAEMSQLEAARKIYLQGAENQRSTSSGGDETGAAAAADVTKMELLRAIDVRLGAVKQDLTTACARASAAGFTPDTVSELQFFSERFGAHRLNEACTKFISVNERRPDLICPWTIGGDDRAIRYSSGSDMSIDDQAEETQQKNQRQTIREQDSTQHEQSGPSSAQQPSSLRGSSSERGDGKGSERMTEKDDEKMNELPQKSQHVRRLSVQDRINMFENKQKEQTPKGSGGKVVVTKSVELRRMSSDVSSSGQTEEKAVLRRWSGTSDMSIDQSNEKRETESSDSTPGPSSDSQSQATPLSVNQNKDFGGSQGTPTSSTAEFLGSLVTKEDSGLKGQAVSYTEDGGLQGSEKAIQSKAYSSESSLVDKSASQPQIKTFSGRTKDVSPKDETPSVVEFRARAASQSRFGFFGAEQSGFKLEAGSQTLRRASSSGADLAGLKDQTASQSQFRATPDLSDNVEVKNLITSQTQFRASVSRMEDVGPADAPYQVPRKAFPSRSADVKKRDEVTSQIPVRASSPSSMNIFGSDSKDKSMSELQSRPFSAKSKGSSGSRTPSISRPQSRDLASDLSAQQSQWGFQGKIDEAGKKMQFGGYPAGEDDSSFQGMKLQQQSSAPEQIDISAQPQKGKTSKGNQDRNDELQMKADELEKLFAAHKLRVPGESTTTSRRSKPTSVQMDQVPTAINKKTVEVSPVQLSAKSTVRQSVSGSGKGAKLDVTPLMKMAENRNYGPELVFSEDSRGKFYDQYMLKRNAKLKEEWSSGRGQKEAKLKAMQDSLERSRVEMEAKFAESAERRDSPLYARQRAEKLRSFNVRSSMSRGQALEFSVDMDEILSESSENTQYEQDGSFSETFVRDGSSRSVQSKKHLPNRNQSSSTSRISTVPVPRSSTKSTNSNSGRRRAQPDNPLAQSVPNFSDFRKENTKPSSGITKAANRTQVRNYSRSKSTIEGSQLIKDDKPRCQSMRKSIAAPSELKDLSSPLNTQTEQSIYSRLSKKGESKPFLKKGNGIGPGSGAGVAKMKASTGPDILKIEEEYDDLEDQLEGSAMKMVNEEDEEQEFEIELVDDDLKDLSYLSDSDDEKLEITKESEKSNDYTELGGDEVLRSFCQVDRDSVAELALPSKFHNSLGQMQDSPSESPVSWNSHAHHPFSYIHESSDVDASMDSPVGSPASWNSQSLAQMEADAARMRKKWGSAQPVVVANSLNHQSRKDVAKGFKRLLKFGRKSRGTESLVDWISATTSEGDDDTDDGRDFTNRSSEDLRKSRMGLSHDVLNDGDLFNEQVQVLRNSIPNAPAHFRLRDDHLSGNSLKAPKSSFFSLSSFRSKGSESKPR